MQRVGLMMVVLVACAPQVEPDAGDSTTGAPTSSSSAAATTAMLDGGSSSASTSTSTTGTDPSTSTDAPGTDDGIKLDAYHHIETCEAANSELIDLEITTPDGPFVATNAWWAWENCCLRHPRFVITGGAPLEVDNGDILGSYVIGYVRGERGHTGPFVGPLTVEVDTEPPYDSSTFESGFELLAPLDPDAPEDGEQPRISASFAIEGEGWSMQGSVQALYCAALETPPCPCE